MIILGIDPGIERVGIAVVERNGGKETYLYSECFKTSSKLPHAERLALIGAELLRVVKEWKPNGMAIEKLFFETNTKTAMVVAEARGVMLYCAATNGLKLYEYTPLEIKVAVTGYGKSDKRGVMDMVPRLIKLPERTDSTGASTELSRTSSPQAMIDDEVDAIAVALTCFAYEKIG